MTPIPPLDLLYQDDDLVVVNKPSGLISESRDPDEDSLVRRVTDWAGRPATLYHRLDRLTTGCILLGRTARFNRAIGLLFENKQVRKEYRAVVEGVWPRRGSAGSRPGWPRLAVGDGKAGRGTANRP
ncbi:MAG: pseudouridine synthase [Opitutaceae bacterium]